jgi:hypothetical protein
LPCFRVIPINPFFIACEPELGSFVWRYGHTFTVFSIYSKSVAICCMFRCYAKTLWHYPYEISSSLPTAWTVIHFFPWTYSLIYNTFSCFLHVDRLLECSAWVLVGSKNIRQDWNVWDRSTSDLHCWFIV